MTTSATTGAVLRRTPTGSSRTGRRSGSRRGRAVGRPAVAAVLVVLVGAVTSWVLLSPEGHEPSAPVESTTAGSPRLVSGAELAELGSAAAPLYWAGPREGVQYEVTQNASGTTFVRYLPVGVSAGSSDPHLTVATYPEPQGSGALAAAVVERGLQSWTTRSGALVASDPAAPLSAYFSFPDGTFQVEVFSPVAGDALAVVLDGSVRPLGASG